MIEVVGTVRASAWPALFDCSLRYYYQTIMGYSSPSTGRSRVGNAFHASTAAFDRGRAENVPISIDDAAGVFVDDLRRDADSVVWDQTLSRKDAERIGISLTTRYCATIAPYRTYSAIEVKCEALEIETAYGIVRLTGQTDRTRIYNDGREGVTDLKSGKRAVEGTRAGTPRAVTKGHHLQIGVYALMAEHATKRALDGPGEVIGAQVSATNPVVASGYIQDVRTPLIGTPETPGLITIAAQMLKSGLFPPNPRSMYCSAKYCGGHSRCPYKATTIEFDEPDAE